MKRKSSTQSAAQNPPETATNPAGLTDPTSENTQPPAGSPFDENCPIPNLHPDPNQIGTYGQPGGPHDPTFEDLVASIAASGVLEPLLASRGNGELRDGTIISGHRRYAAAVRLNLGTVPVRWITHQTADEAAMARIDSNRQRVKNLWVRGMELRAEKEIEARRAKERQRQSGGARPGRRDPAPVTPSQGVTARAPTVLEILAKSEGRNKHVVDSLLKLVELGCQETDPSKSVVALALATATWSDIGRIAAQFGVGSAKAPPRGTASVGTPSSDGDGGITPPSEGAATVIRRGREDEGSDAATTSSPPSTSIGATRRGGAADSGDSPSTSRPLASTVTDAGGVADIPHGTGVRVASPTRHEPAGTASVPVRRAEPTAAVPAEKSDADTRPGDGKSQVAPASRKVVFVPLDFGPHIPKRPKPKRPFPQLLKTLHDVSLEVCAAVDHPIDEMPDEDFLRDVFAYVRCCLATLEECFPNQAVLEGCEPEENDDAIGHHANSA